MKVGDEKPAIGDLQKVYRSLLPECGAEGRDVLTMDRRSSNEGLSFFTKTLPQLGKALDAALGSGLFKLPSAFKKRWRDSEIPAFLGSLFGRIFHRNGQIRENADVQAIKSLRQVLFFAYKLELPFSDEVRAEKVREFIKVDSELPDLKVRYSTTLARQFTKKVFSSYDGEITPSHGSGAVANVPHKDKFVFYPPLSICVNHFGLTMFLRETESQTFFFALFVMAFFKAFGVYDVEVYPYKPHAKIVLVPKDSRGPRLISCEPVEHQYVQQGMRKWTQNRIESHYLSKGNVNFEDQDVNRNLVQKHSIDKAFSTLDLKDASDRITLELVEYLFGDCHHYLSDLLACRSEWTTYESDTYSVTHRLRKFAPMGSAVCFTTLAWCIYALLLGDLVAEGVPLEEAQEVVYVYGDDVICETWYAHRASDVLEFHGLTVNTAKSFIDSNFLESCGNDCFKGITVTPVRARRLVPICAAKTNSRIQGNTASLRRISEERSHSILSTVSLAQNLHLAGLPATAELLYSSVEQCLQCSLPYGLLDSPYLCRLTSSSSDAWRTNQVLDLERRFKIRVYVTSAVVAPVSENPNSRIRRTFPLLGTDLKSLPKFGEYVAPRRVVLRQRTLGRNFSLAYC